MKNKIIITVSFLVFFSVTIFSQPIVYSTYIGGIEEDIPDNMAMGEHEAIYISGTTKSSNFPIAGSAVDNTINGDRDIFLLKMDTETTAINPNRIDKKTALFPNPTNGLITLAFNDETLYETNVTISNLQGAILYSNVIQNPEVIDLSGNSTGIYLIKVITDRIVYEERLIKE